MEKARYHHILMFIFILLLTTGIGFILKEEFLVDVATYLIFFLGLSILREFYVLLSIINSSSIIPIFLPNGKKVYIVEDDQFGINAEAIPTIFKCFIKSSSGMTANEFILMHEYGHFKKRHILLQMVLFSIFLSYVLSIMERGGLHHAILYGGFTFFLLKKMFKSEEDQADIYALEHVKNFEKIKSAFDPFDDQGASVLMEKFNPKTLWQYTIPNKGFKRIFLYVTWLFSFYSRGIPFVAAYIYALLPFTRTNGILQSSRFILVIFVIIAPQIFQLFYRAFNINTTYYSITGTTPNSRSLRASSYRNSKERLNDLYKLLNKNLSQNKKSKFEFFSHLRRMLLKFLWILIGYMYISAGTFINLPYFGYGFKYHIATLSISTRAMKTDPKLLYYELEKMSSNGRNKNSILYGQFRQSYEMDYESNYDINDSIGRFWESLNYILLISPPPQFVNEFYKDILAHFVQVTDAQKKTLYYIHCKRPQTRPRATEYTTDWVVSTAAATHKMIKTGDNVTIEEVKEVNYFSFLPILWNEYLFIMSIILIILSIAVHVTIKLKSRITKPSIEL